MGLSRNKVAVPEGAAGTPPFWSVRTIVISGFPTDTKISLGRIEARFSYLAFLYSLILFFMIENE